MGADPHPNPLTDAALRALVRLAVAHGASDNAIAVVISMSAALLGAPRSDVRARSGADIRRQVRAVLTERPAGGEDPGRIDCDLLARIAALGEAGTADDLAGRVLDALGKLPDAARDAAVRGPREVAAREAVARALAAAAPDRRPDPES